MWRIRERDRSENGEFEKGNDNVLIYFSHRHFQIQLSVYHIYHFLYIRHIIVLGFGL